MKKTISWWLVVPLCALSAAITAEEARLPQ